VTLDRRAVLHAGLGGLAVLGVSARLTARGTRLSTQKLGDKILLITGAPGNVVAGLAGDDTVLVDSGAAALAGSLRASLPQGRVRTLFNTHYHADQTGGNALFAKHGATIHAHVITRQWLATDYYVPAEDRWVRALPAAAVPSATFRLRGELLAGTERIEYGYLLEAHTRGDIYVYFRDSNVLAVGDVASPQRDPALDWYAGGWLGGRVDGMDDLLKLANDATRIVPAYGPVMTRAELATERDMMLKLYERTTLLTTQGHSAQDMLDAGVMTEVSRKFQDPYRFLYDVSKGHWAHYTNFGGNIV
jgi:glyoxylase-like metal-dependent hydrolase (beta-lactamase superfamily II)